MRKDDGVDGDAQRIGQLTWMLFLKIFDQCEEAWEDDAADRHKKYKSPIPEDCRWRNWAKYVKDKEGKKKPQIQASDLIKHVNDKVFIGLQNLVIDGDEKAKVVRDVFIDANNYMKSGTLMLAVIEKLDEAINFHDLKSRGQMGAIYEQILNDLRSAGNAGEFYTPRAVTEFMVRMVNPSLKSAKPFSIPLAARVASSLPPLRIWKSRSAKNQAQKIKKPSPSASGALRKNSSRICSAPPI